MTRLDAEEKSKSEKQSRKGIRETKQLHYDEVSTKKRKVMENVMTIVRTRIQPSLAVVAMQVTRSRQKIKGTGTTTIAIKKHIEIIHIRK